MLKILIRLAIIATPTFPLAPSHLRVHLTPGFFFTIPLHVQYSQFATKALIYGGHCLLPQNHIRDTYAPSVSRLSFENRMGTVLAF